MIRLNKGAQPQILIDNSTVWTAEYVNWCTNQDGPEPRRYAHREIRSALEIETNHKCAYCEARISDVAYEHIEHKLPKRKHPQLVCIWNNLTIACPRCNTNKGDYDDPECPLLDPHIDDVENEVAFGGPMALGRGGDRARATITILKLNRMELLFARTELLSRLDWLLDIVERLGTEPAALRALWLDIDEMTTDAGEFASACRQFLASQMAERGISSSSRPSR